jgi:hypothetical protein
VLNMVRYGHKTLNLRSTSILGSKTLLSYDLTQAMASVILDLLNHQDRPEHCASYDIIWSTISEPIFEHHADIQSFCVHHPS